jgi:hypothetical protein
MTNEYPPLPTGDGRVPVIRRDYNLDGVAYEHDVRDATRKALQLQMGRDDEPRELLEVALEGKRPTTEVVVTVRELGGGVRELRFPVWKEPVAHGCPDDGSIPIPDFYALNVVDWVLESIN